MKPAEVRWARAAVRDIERVDELLTAQNEQAAIALNAEVARTVDSLAHFRRRGRTLIELRRLGIRTEYREVVIRRFRLVYRVDGPRLLIVAFFDSRRDAETSLQFRLAQLD